MSEGLRAGAALWLLENYVQCRCRRSIFLVGRGHHNRCPHTPRIFVQYFYKNRLCFLIIIFTKTAKTSIIKDVEKRFWGGICFA